MRLRWVGVAFLALVMGAAGARAQDENGAPMAMGGGRMIRGTVTGVAADHLTLKTEAGDVYTVALTPNTNVRKGRDKVTVADVHVGDGAGAMGLVDAPNKTVHAMMVAVVDAEQMKKAREALGKTMIVGKVTAIDEVKLTVLRSDGVTQVIQVDEDTSFKRGRGMRGMGMDGMMMGGNPDGGGGGRRGPGAEGGAPAAESITLADVKVGDNVAGPGALKAGVFVPTQLMVATPGQGGGRGRGRDGQGNTPAATPPPAGGQ